MRAGRGVQPRPVCRCEPTGVTMPLLRTIAALCCMARGDRDRLAGRYGRAERRIKEALASTSGGGRLEQAIRARLLNRLGMTYKYQGRLTLSARAYRRAFQISSRLFPEDHSLLATHYHNLAGLEHARGNCVEAEPLARHGLAIRERAVGPGHAAVGRDLAALAAILDGTGRHEEAEALHRRALEILRRHGRSERREHSYALANLAACLHLMGRTEEAEALAREALKLQRKVLGVGHPDLAATLANLESMRRSSQSSGSSRATGSL